MSTCDRPGMYLIGVVMGFGVNCNHQERHVRECFAALQRPV